MKKCSAKNKPIYPDPPTCHPRPSKPEKSKKKSKCKAKVTINVILKFADREHKIKC